LLLTCCVCVLVLLLQAGAAVRATGCCLLLPACPCLGDWSPRAGRARWRGAPVPPPPVGRQSAATRSDAGSGRRTRSRVRLPSRLP